MQYTIRFLPADITVNVPAGSTLLDAQIHAGLHPDSPCGGHGTCGKCKVLLESGETVLACQVRADCNMTVHLESGGAARILTQSRETFSADGANDYCIAFDVGTTTVVGYLMDGKSGQVLAQEGRMNPQHQFGADVISRIQYVLDGHSEQMKGSIHDCLNEMTARLSIQVGLSPAQIGRGALVGNTAMHHLLLGIDPRPLVTPPYMPVQREAMDISLLPIGGKTRVLPNIAGFVGGDTVGCMTAVEFDRLDKLTLLIDIGTNGEMVLGNRHRRISCSTAAGPAFEGAKISCGMRGAEGAVDHVFISDGAIHFHVIGERNPKGLCGSGLLDLIAVLLDSGELDESGYLEAGAFQLNEAVTLTQKDVREVQLAKAAIRAGIELMAQRMERSICDIQRVYLAGAFGNYLNPHSACRIGMIPSELENRIEPIGNAAGEGAKRCCVSSAEFARSIALAEKTEFLELAGLPEFQDRYVDALLFSEEEP